MLDDLALFVAIVEAGGLAGAAKQAGVPAATVTRRLQKLEQRLGAQLLHRSARRFALTSEGDAYYQALGPLFGQLNHALRGLSADLRDMRGPLTVAAPTNLTLKLLQPMWSQFTAAYPDVFLDLRISNQPADLIASGVDIALRVGPQTDGRLYQKRVGRARSLLVASPTYIEAHGMPASPEELTTHRILAASVYPAWSLACTDSRTYRAELSPATVVDDIGLASMMAVDGLGIALLPVPEVIAELRAGQLCQVLPEWSGPEREIFVVWPTGRLLSARARTMRDFMEAFIATEPALQGEVPV